MNKRKFISDDEIIRLYNNGVRDFTPYIVELAEPEGLNLSGVDFTGQDLSECFMPGINLSNAKLSGVVFLQSNLDGADLSGADLSGANFTETSFTGTNFTDTNLTNAILEITRFSDCIFTNTNMTGLNLSGGIFRRNKYNNAIMPDGLIRTGTD